MMRSGAILLALLFVPLAAAEASPVTLYLHLNGFHDAQINTQVPEAWDTSASPGPYFVSECIDVPSVTTYASKQYHTWYAYHSPTAVEYDYIDTEGKPRIHPERGLDGDVVLDGDSIFHWYLASDDATSVDIVPESTLRVTVRTGDDISVGNQAFNEGDIIAFGETAPTLLAPGTDTGEVVHHDVDGRDVYAFHVPLAHALDRIPRDEAYNIRIDLIQPSPQCDDEHYATTADIWPYQAPDMWNRWEIQAVDPIFIASVEPFFVEDGLAVRSSSDSVFGNYDLLLGSFDVTGPQGAVGDLFEQLALTARTREHSHHTSAVDTAWLLSYQELGLEDGVYRGNVTFVNLQGTATASADFLFEIGGDQALCGTADGEYGCVPLDVAQEAPGPALPLLALALLAVAIRRRHR